MEEAEAYVPVRLDAYLAGLHPKYSRAQIQRFIKDGNAQVNGEVKTKTGTLIKEHDSVTMEVPDHSSQQFTELEIPILYEDADCVVINKPLGVLTHSKGVFNPEPTVASWLSQRPHFELINNEENQRAGIVHRLDRATSGVMICAKNQIALTHLQKQFQDRKAKKTYIARVIGSVDPPEAIIDLPIERNPKQPQRFRVGQNGKASVTVYKVLEESKGRQITSLLELKPTTGRTHQLRVHLHYVSHPIIGDTFYDGKPADRLYLHAKALEITLPNKQRQTFETETPEEFYGSF